MNVNFNRFAFFLSIPFILPSCATPTAYGPEGSTGGYTNFKLAPNIYKVVFKANGFTSNSGCENMALLRGAELALIDGCGYFEVLQGGTKVDTDTTYIPGQSTIQTNSYGQAYGSANAHAYAVGNHVYGNATGSSSSYGTSYTTITESPPIPITSNKPSTIFVIRTLSQKKPGCHNATELATAAKGFGLSLDSRVSAYLPALESKTEDKDNNKN